MKWFSLFFISPHFIVLLVPAQCRLPNSEPQRLNTKNELSNNATSMCERIHPEDLPDECVCHDKPPLGLVVQCLKVFNSTFFNDTIGMTIDVDPCNSEGSSVSVYITELDHNIKYVVASVRAGEEEDYPIPGLSVIVPGLGHVGIDVAIYIAGNPDDLLMKIGLNACAAMSQRTICASSIPGLSGILPWWVLSGTYHFGDICESNSTNFVPPRIKKDGMEKVAAYR